MRSEEFDAVIVPLLKELAALCAAHDVHYAMAFSCGKGANGTDEVLVDTHTNEESPARLLLLSIICMEEDIGDLHLVRSPGTWPTDFVASSMRQH